MKGLNSMRKLSFREPSRQAPTASPLPFKPHRKKFSICCRKTPKVVTKTTTINIVDEAKLEFGKDGLRMQIALSKFYWVRVWGDVPAWLKHEYPTIPWPN